MKIIVFAPFINPNALANRPAQIASVLAEFGSVEVVTTNFDHGIKQYRTEYKQAASYAVRMLPTLSYKSNTSLRRMMSHALFGIRAAVFFLGRRRQYDVVYATLPLNLLTWLIFLLATKGTLRIVDVIDIWPDVLPFSPRLRSAMAPFFWIWKRFLISAIQQCDVLLSVSDTFLDETKTYFQKDESQCRRFYIGHPLLQIENCDKESILTLCYIGNIGTLYDFDTLVDALTDPEFIKRFQVFIIGDGDRREWLLNELQRRKIAYQYFGTIYEEKQLSSTLGRCHIGFNGYINTSATFSYKATTYFSAGLPILNSMGGDLERLVESQQLGYNYRGGSTESLTEALRKCQHELLATMGIQCSRFAKRELEIKTQQENIEFFLEPFIPYKPNTAIR